MARGQTWISTVGNMRPVLEMAKSLYPGESDTQALQSALLDWYYDQKNGGKHEAVIESNNRILELLEKMNAM